MSLVVVPSPPLTLRDLDEFSSSDVSNQGPGGEGSDT